MRSQLQEQKIAREAQLLQQAIQRKEAEKTYQELCAAAEKKAEAVEAESAQMVQKVKQMERSVQDTLAAIDEVRQKCAAADELKRTTTKELTETQARIDSLTKQIAETQQATTKFTAKLDTILSVFNKNE
ncbi:hypothetical protein Pelo_965 [Pelomyxa schiedti]|nr:hypothetical protein Pelo_965 [Pelomyxa schiedti]